MILFVLFSISKPKLPEVTIHVANHSVEYHHLMECFQKLRAEVFIICNYRRHPAFCHQPSNWKKRDFWTGKQLTCGTEGSLPAGKAIGNAADPIVWATCAA